MSHTELVIGPILAVLACMVLAILFARRAGTAGQTSQQLESGLHELEQKSKSEAVRLQSRTHALEQEYDTLLARCGAGVLVLDREGVIVRANEPFAQLFGAEPESLTRTALLQATLSSELNGLFLEAHEMGETRQREIRLGDPGGRTMAVTVAPVGEGLPNPARYLLVAEDITELRRLETIRRDFVANVSHELRTPLASIRAMAETLQDGALEDGSVATKFLDTIITEAQRLTRISEDLLILGQAESQTPEKEPLNLSKLVEAVVARFMPQAEKAGITLSCVIAEGLTVSASHDQIEQVLVNLIDNAIKYTPSGGNVYVTANRDGESVSVRVTDTGIGIMSQDLPRIFERFYRVDKARSRQSGGTGLGLSIVKHIVESHGGQMTVESEYNRGSTFMFTLPIG